MTAEKETVNYWPLVESYFHDKSFAKQEIDSFNQFIDQKLSEIVEENKTIVPKIEEVKLEVSNIEIERPRIIEADGSPRAKFTPMEARIRNRTYSSPVFLTMKLLRRDVEQDVKKAYIGEMPIMVKSNRCWLSGLSAEELIEAGEDPMDFGGYFIVNGSEKALMTQEVLASDRVILSEKADESISAEVISTRGAFKGRVRISRTTDGLLGVTFPASPKKLRLFVLLKALGLKTKREIMDAFPNEAQIQNDVLVNLENTPVKDQEEALDRIGKFVAPGQVIDYRLRRAQEVIDAFLLPHIGQKPEDRLAKAYYLATMATKAVERAYHLRQEDDKDHYANKRLELSGKLMEHLFRYAFKYFIKDLTFQIDRTITRRRKLNINTVVRPGAITERIRFAMSTGNWIGRATGVAKFMDRTNYLAPLTDLRKVKSPLDKNRELYEARDVHGTHWGRLCPIETPDGPQCGLVKNLALLSEVTIETSEDPVEKMLYKMGVKLKKI
ncbi:MAG: DNA-directed RNA polymerase subunit B'' [Candidatus Micrarchaeota archaeon]